MTEIKCKNCRYYTGTQCHGHGEYWGSCMLLEMAYKELNSKTEENEYITDNWTTVLYDETECVLIKKKIYEIKEYKK